jgi:hypothetical protein
MSAPQKAIDLIGQEPFDLIVAEEVTSEALYNKIYQRTEWPGWESGVTIGIGYDCGYTTAERLRRDWQERLPDQTISALLQACGVKGTAAQSLSRRLSGRVVVPWDAALGEFADIEIPRWVGSVRRALPNYDKLPVICRGVLISLAYNRGLSFSNPGDRYREMVAIRQHMHTGEFQKIPAELRSMIRLWTNNSTRGLRLRREHEAALFEHGLATRVAATKNGGTG